jgi:hypothetical protein
MSTSCRPDKWAARVALQFDYPHGGVGVDVFNALVRQVDRIDPGYKL